MKFRSYRDMRVSGIEWAGDIPNHWNTVRVGYLYDVQLGKMLQNDALSDADVEVPYLKAAHVQWGSVQFDELPTMWANPRELDVYHVTKGDLLICEGGEVGRAAIAPELPDRCIIQNALHRVRETPHGQASTEFLYYLMTAINEAGWFDVLCNKATIAHLTEEKLSGLRIPVPPRTEQEIIVDYLNEQVGVTDRVIEKYRLLLNHLQEYRQALISQAVTKGLDPNVPMKDSGIPWLGRVPEHWDILRLKYLTPEITVGIVVTPAKYYVDGVNAVPCLRSLNVLDNGLSDSNLVYISPESNFLHAKSILRKGDIVVVRTGTPGMSAVVDDRFDGANCIDLIIVRQSSKFDSYFLSYVMNSMSSKYQYELFSGGAIQQHFNVTMAKELLLPVPPLEEQHQIAVFLRQKLTRIDALCDKVRDMVYRLQHYRQALITAAVTGKIDVRQEVQQHAG